ncbi:MAG: hypothetical protein KDA85_01455, partial [Planctomycetaceae bacterium]|nr:hypothetical protein [Planctomycetaceae bacterium]
MDLPSCPSCGQSVLDDDAVDCPFCGAAMAGGGKSKPSSGASRTTKPGKPASTSASNPSARGPSTGNAKSARPVQSGIRADRPVADEEDPFDLGEAAGQRNVLQALAKPERGKLHKVMCPMCDKPSFVSKSAIGRQVRCSNPKCMIPVFTVPDPDAAEAEVKTPARGRTSSDAEEAVVKAAAPPGKRGSMLVYGIGAAVLLVLTFVGKYFLDNYGTGQSSDLERPFTPGQVGSFQPTDGGDDPDTSTEDVTTTTQTTEPEVVVAKDPVAEAHRLARLLAEQAVHEKKDKGFIRRTTAATYFRLGMTTEGEAELKQLVSLERAVAGNRRLYLQIEPLLTDYWRLKPEGQATASARLDAAMQLAQDVPNIGRIELESILGTVAALVAESRLEDAQKLLSAHQRDRTNDAHRDTMAGVTWFHLASRMRDHGATPLPVSEVFAWNDALWICVGMELAIQDQWNAFDVWQKSAPSPADRADLLSSATALGRGLSADVIARLESSGDAAGPLIALRVRATLARQTGDADRLADCEQRLSQLTTRTAMAMPSLSELTDYRPANTDAVLQEAQAAAAVAVAALVQEQRDLAQLAINRTTAALSSIAPPTAITRAAVGDVERDSRRVKARLKSELGLMSDQQTDTKFRAYRTAVNRLANSAEQRRTVLIVQLSQIARQGGADLIQASLSDSE